MISFVNATLESDIEKHLYGCYDSLADEILVNGTGADEVIIIIKPEQKSKEELLTMVKERYGDLVRCEFSHGNRSVAKNIGLKMAKNNIITFLDSDTVISRGFIPATIEDFEKGYAYVNYSARPLDEEVADKRRLFFYARFMNLHQWIYTHVGNKFYRPYGFCMSVRKDFCERIAKNSEVFLEILAGYGEDAEFGRRYGDYCDKLGVRGKYEKSVIVKTSFREWYRQGLWGGGARMIRNTWETPYRKRPVVSNWK